MACGVVVVRIGDSERDMSETFETVRVTLRLPGDLHTDVAEFAKGDRTRPKASLNETLVFLVRAGLDQQRRQQEAAQAPRGAEAVPEAAGAAHAGEAAQGEVEA
jgi:hypothetical protein